MIFPERVNMLIVELSRHGSKLMRKYCICSLSHCSTTVLYMTLYVCQCLHLNHNSSNTTYFNILISNTSLLPSLLLTLLITCIFAAICG